MTYCTAEYQDRLAALEDYVQEQYEYDYGYNGYDNYDPYLDAGYY